MKRSLSNIFTVASREINAYIHAPATYIFIIIFLVLAGFFTFIVGNLFESGQASLAPFFYWMPWLFLILAPSAGMSLWADEKRGGTIELLMTFPLSAWECICGKFLASWMLIAVSVILTFPLPLTVAYLGDPDWGVIICGYIGIILLGAVFLAVSNMTSTFTRSPVISFISSFLICFFLIISAWPPVYETLSSFLPAFLMDVLAFLSVTTHVGNISRGLIELKDIIYFISLIAFCLTCAGIVLGMYRAGNHGKASAAFKERIFTSAWGILVLLLLVFSVNFIASFLGMRFDLTENRIYTLSKGSVDVIKAMPKGRMVIRFYCSRKSVAMPVALKSYSSSVENLLREYVKASGGKLKLEKYDPAPDSDAEEAASIDGVSGQVLNTGERIYFGISISFVDKVLAIPFLNPQEESSLEYDITRLISRISMPAKPVIGVMSPLSVLGNIEELRRNPYTQNPVPELPWASIAELQKDFELKKISMESVSIPDGIDALLIIHPVGITEQTQYAIDQFLLKGGNLGIFVDPCSFYSLIRAQKDQAWLDKRSSDLPVLFKSWGIAYTPNLMLSDMTYALRKTLQDRMITNPLIPTFTKEAFDRNDIVSSKLENVTSFFIGTFNYAGKNTSRILIASSTDSQAVSSFVAERPELAVANFKSAGKSLPVALRIDGKFDTAFPDGSPLDKASGAKNKAVSLKTSAKSSTVLVFGDADMLVNDACVRPVDGGNGQKVFVRQNDNISLLQNVAELIAGGTNLTSLRCRESSARPFLVVNALRSKAEQRYKNKVMELEKELRETEMKLNKLQRSKTSKDEMMIMSPEQQKELKEFEAKSANARKEIKKFRKELRADIDSLENYVKFINIFLIPLLIAIAGGILIWRRHIRSYSA